MSTRLSHDANGELVVQTWQSTLIQGRKRNKYYTATRVKFNGGLSICSGRAEPLLFPIEMETILPGLIVWCIRPIDGYWSDGIDPWTHRPLSVKTCSFIGTCLRLRGQSQT